MNLLDSSFLCLDIGTYSVRGIAHRVKSGKISKSALFSVSSFDTVFAIKSVCDELEKQLGTRFYSAYITGNFGEFNFSFGAQETEFGSEHKITNFDIQNQISGIVMPDDFFPMHIIPYRYETTSVKNLLSPVGYTDTGFTSVFGVISYKKSGIHKIMEALRRSHIQSDSFFDPSFLLSNYARKRKQTAIFIDMGAADTTVSLWTPRGPVLLKKIKIGGIYITRKIAEKLNIKFSAAEIIKRAAGNMSAGEMDRFTPADSAYDFSRSDLNEIIKPYILEIISDAKGFLNPFITKYNPGVIFLSGGGSEMPGMPEYIEDMFQISVETIGADATIGALSDNIWQMQSGRIKKYLRQSARIDSLVSRFGFLFRKRKVQKKFIPIMPSTLAFNMGCGQTYDLFKSGNIGMIHIDIMDGFFVDRVFGGIEKLKQIRKKTDAHLYVHLMTESPTVWAQDAIDAGADTIIVSAGTDAVRTAICKIRERKKRCGIALDIEKSVDDLKPFLRDIDDVLIMAVKTGSGGGEFDNRALRKISILANTRKRFGLNYKITVDGGINAETAKLCWAAGADFLVSGSYLAKSENFAAAVNSLLPQE